METASKTFTWEEVVARDKATVEKVCSDESFAYYFIYVVCEPLLRKILWTVFNNDADYDELANELYLHLKKPDEDGEYWHNLKTFDYRTSLFDWVKTVAIRLFVGRKNEPLFIPKELVENGAIKEIAIKLEKALDRKLIQQYVVNGLSPKEVCKNLNIEPKSFNSVYSSLVRKVKSIIKKQHPEYLSLFESEQHPDLDSLVANSNDSIDNKIDIAALINHMPNERYRYVIRKMYIDDASAEKIAEELCTPISNVYNLRLRALEQLRDVAIVTREFPDIEKYIRLLPDDRIRVIATSLLVKGESYEEIAKTYSLSQCEFRQIKKKILSELKKLIYKKNS